MLTSKNNTLIWSHLATAFISFNIGWFLRQKTTRKPPDDLHVSLFESIDKLEKELDIEEELDIEKNTPTQIEGNMFRAIGERLSSYST
jgi:hypothetical protein